MDNIEHPELFNEYKTIDKAEYKKHLNAIKFKTYEKKKLISVIINVLGLQVFCINYLVYFQAF